MPVNILEQLAEQQVPAKPAELDRLVHDRINTHLLLLHLIEVLFLALPFAFVHFFQALTGALFFSLTGRFPQQGEDHAGRHPQSGN